MPSSEKSLIENNDTLRPTWLQRSTKFIRIYLRYLQKSTDLRGRAQNRPTRLPLKSLNWNQRHSKSISAGVDHRCPQKIQTQIGRSLRLPTYYRQVFKQIENSEFLVASVGRNNFIDRHQIWRNLSSRTERFPSRQRK